MLLAKLTAKLNSIYDQVFRHYLTNIFTIVLNQCCDCSLKKIKYGIQIKNSVYGYFSTNIKKNSQNLGIDKYRKVVTLKIKIFRYVKVITLLSIEFSHNV